jgi:cyclase|tara:strand:- start:255 stop:1130 length:876 start_codon:yes stop_codon:yes gene_type:complete
VTNNIRIIPRLDIKGPNLVKGVHLEGLRVLGKPEHFAEYYNESGADELIYMDAVASLYDRNSLVDIINRTAKKIFIPLTVGGGLRNIDDIRTVLQAGADKVSINTAAIKNPGIIKEASRRYGSSAIVVSIEAIRKEDGSYEAFIENGRQRTGRDVFEWALEVAELGAGEILILSIDREGTGKGFDIELTRRIAQSVSIPVIACGGAGTREHIFDVIQEGYADAVSVASILHYNFIRHYEIDDSEFHGEGNIDYMKKKYHLSNMDDATIPEIKEFLAEKGIECRSVNMIGAN